MFRLVFVKAISIYMLFVGSCLAQQQEFINGKLVDSETKEPVVFATIRIKGRALGVISNMDGSFRIPRRLKRYGASLFRSNLRYCGPMLIF